MIYNLLYSSHYTEITKKANIHLKLGLMINIVKLAMITYVGLLDYENLYSINI